jgi:DNA-binding GntR family transcriptional regulator
MERDVTATTGTGGLDLDGDRALLERSSTAERIAAILRDHISEGRLLPGTRLSESSLSSALNVSRNTLREAFRLLAHERLVVHRHDRGVFVRELGPADVIDLYRVRRVLECAAVDRAGSAQADTVRAVREAVEAGERAAAAGRWDDVATASIHFHQAVTALAGSDRLDELMRQILAEIRLIYPGAAISADVYRDYLARHRDIASRIERGDLAGARDELDGYLQDSERLLLESFTGRPAPSNSAPTNSAIG